MENNKIFLAANSMNGFCSFFEDYRKQNDEWYYYIIKGGAGTGKSTAMKKVASDLTHLCPDLLTVPCSSDPDSLDAVVFPSKKIIIADGTAPHVIEPKFIGATDQLVNFCDTFNYEMLDSKKEDIINISSRISNIYLQIYRYTKALGSLLDDRKKILQNPNDAKKAEKLAQKMFKKYIPKNLGKPTVNRCFFSAVTHKGIINYDSTIKDLSEKTIAFFDEYGVTSFQIINKLITLLQNTGYNFFVGYNPIIPTIAEHIVIPELKLSFISVNDLFQYNYACKKVNVLKYLNSSVYAENTEKLKFNSYAVKQIAEKTTFIMKEAKNQHDLLEKVYFPAVDFKKVDKLTENLINDIKNKIM